MKKRMAKAERRKNILLARSRIKRGRAHTKATKVNVTTVAKEAGVSTSLLYNCFPDIVEEILGDSGRSSRAQRDAKHAELVLEKEKTAALKIELEELKGMVATLASRNEVLQARIRVLEGMKNAPNVSDFDSARRGK